MRALWIAAILALASGVAWSDTTSISNDAGAVVHTACSSSGSAPYAWVPCSGSGGGGGNTVAPTAAGTSATTANPVQGVTGGVPMPVTDATVVAAIASSAITPPSAATPVVSTSAEATHVLKASAGNLRSVYATNLTSTAGFLTVTNAITAQADGAMTPIACVPLPANGTASLVYGDWAPASYSTGITAIITSAATCFTKTTGVITGFISGSVQ